MDAYLEAATAFCKFTSGRCSLKTAIYDSSAGNLRRVFALCMEAAKARGALEAAVAASGLGAAARAGRGRGAELLFDHREQSSSALQAGKAAGRQSRDLRRSRTRGVRT